MDRTISQLAAANAGTVTKGHDLWIKDVCERGMAWAGVRTHGEVTLDLTVKVVTSSTTRNGVGRRDEKVYNKV